MNSAPSPGRPGSMRDGVRAAAALALAFLMLGLLGGPARAAETAPQVTISAGWQGISQSSGQWVPVTITVRGGSQDVTAELVLTSVGGSSSQGGQNCISYSYPGGGGQSCTSGGAGPGCFGPGCQVGGGSPIIDRVPVVVSAGVTRRYTMQVIASGQTLHAELVAGSVHLAAKDLPLRTGADTQRIAVVSESSGGPLDAIGALHLLGGSASQVVTIPAAELPADAFDLQTFGAIVLDQASTAPLTPAQRSALANYVRGGGGLLVAAGPEVRATVDGLPVALLPATAGPTVDVPSLPILASLLGAPALASPVPVSVLSPAEGAVVSVGDGGRPLVVETALGSGRVAMVAVDLAADPIASWPGRPALLRQLLGRVLPQPGGVGKGAIVQTSLLGTPFSSASGMVQPLTDIPAVQLPSSAVFGFLLLGYAVLAGPVSYLVLGRRRRDLMWATVPLLAVAVGGGIYLTGLGTRDSGATLSEVRVLTLNGSTGSQALVETYDGLFVGRGGSFTIDEQGQPSLAGLSVANLGDTSGSLSVVHGSPPQVQLRDAGSASMHGFSSAAYRDLGGGVLTDLHAQGDRIKGTVVNHLGVALRLVHIVGNGASVNVGDLADGATARVDLPSTFNGNVGGPGGPFVPPGSPGSPSGAGHRGEDVINALSGSGFGAPVGLTPPELVGIAAAPLIGPTAAGHNVHLDTIDAVVLPLTPLVSESAAATGRIIDVVPGTSGAGFGGPGPGAPLFLGSGGVEVFEFSLGRGRAGPARVSVRCTAGGTPQGCPLVQVAGPTATAAPQFEAFDATTGTWTTLTSSDATKPIAVADIAPLVNPDGVMLVRLRVTTGGPPVFVSGQLVVTPAPGPAA